MDAEGGLSRARRCVRVGLVEATKRRRKERGRFHRSEGGIIRGLLLLCLHVLVMGVKEWDLVYRLGGVDNVHDQAEKGDIRHAGSDPL